MFNLSHCKLPRPKGSQFTIWSMADWDVRAGEPISTYQTDQGPVYIRTAIKQHGITLVSLFPFHRGSFMTPPFIH